MRFTDPKVNQLRAVPGLAALDKRSLRRLLPLVEEAAVAPGQVLMEQGAGGRELFIIVDGTGRVSIDGEQVATVGPGDFVGEMAMLDRQPRTATVVAESPMRLLAVGQAAFGTFIDQTAVARAVAAQLAGRLRQAEAAS
jgi:CRP-like cAMP-binding protein